MGVTHTHRYTCTMMMKHIRLLFLLFGVYSISCTHQVYTKPSTVQNRLLQQQQHASSSESDCKSVTSGTNPTELAALKSLYTSTGGSDWVNNDGWSTSGGDPCKDGWFGVCCNSEGHVTQINLPSNRLLGQLPEESWSSFTYLTALRMAGNYLQGSIPAAIFQMQTLEVLELDRNQFEGALPITIKMASLVNLTLSSNELGGVLPTTWIAPKLQIVSLSSNRFEGALPDSLQSVKTLVELDLSVNSLSGSLPFEFGNLVSLEKLWLFENQFESGEIPENWLYQMKSMRNFQMNGLSGQIPNSIGSSWPELETLILVNGRLTGGIPTSMCNLRNLKYLHIFYNNISDVIPKCLCSNADSSIISIDLSNNLLTGPIPTCIGDLSNLHYLYLSNNGLTGALPSSLGNLKNLYSLDVSSNRLSGSIPASLASLKISLNQFDLSSNYFSSFDDGLDSFLDAMAHRSCNLYGNPFSCPVPTSASGRSSCNAMCVPCNTGRNHTSCSICVDTDQYCGWCNDPPNCLGGYEETPYYPYTCPQSEWYFGKAAKCP